MFTILCSYTTRTEFTKHPCISSINMAYIHMLHVGDCNLSPKTYGLKAHRPYTQSVLATLSTLQQNSHYKLVDIVESLSISLFMQGPLTSTVLICYTCIYEGVRVRVSQPSIYNSCRFSFKYVLNALIGKSCKLRVGSLWF